MPHLSLDTLNGDRSVALHLWNIQAGWSEPLLGAHTTLSESSCRGSYGASIMQNLYHF